MPIPSPKTRIFRLHVLLEATLPPIWRRLEVTSGMTLPWLHCAIDLAMGWPSVEAHRFIIHAKAYGNGWGTKVDPQIPEVGHRMDGLNLQAGTTIHYIHNLNRAWRHRVLVEAVGLPQPGVAYPRLTGGARACPPDETEHPEELEALMLPDDPGDSWEQGADLEDRSYDFASFNLNQTSVRFKKALRARVYS